MRESAQQRRAVRNLRIRELAAQGQPRAQSALEFGLTRSMVWVILKEDRDESPYVERCSACGRLVQATSKAAWGRIMEKACPSCGRPGSYGLFKVSR